jgi:hypothetical protein
VFKLVTSGTGDFEGPAQVIPTSGQNTPYIFEILSNRQNNVTVSEAGVDATTGTALRTYVESAPSTTTDFSLDTFIGIANTTANAGVITIELTDLAGNALLPPTPLSLQPNGSVGFQMPDIFGSSPDLKGILRVTSTVAVSVTSVRLRLNERGDLLLSSIPVINEAAAAQSSPLIIPHFATGGGFSAQFVVFSGYANQATSGQLQFFNQAGSALFLDIYAKPSIFVILPGSGAPGATISATISGANLSGATAVTFSGTGVTGSMGVGGSSTSLPVSITVDPSAATTTRTVTVTTTAGTSNVFTGFTVGSGSGFKKRGGQVTSQ